MVLCRLVGLPLIDVLQNIKAWHPSPFRQGTRFTFLKGFLGINVVFNEEHPDLQNMDSSLMDKVCVRNKARTYRKCPNIIITVD